MGSLFGGPGSQIQASVVPPPPVVTPPPVMPIADEEVAKKKKVLAQQGLAAQRGRQSTILSNDVGGATTDLLGG